MLSMLLFFAAVGIVFFAIIGIVLIQEVFFSDVKEVEPQSFIDVNDLPKWQPMTPIQKRSNRVLNKMYKGRAENEQ